MLSSASLSSFLFWAAHLFASLAAGLSGPLVDESFIGLRRGILLPGLVRGLAKLAPRFESNTGEPACETETVDARETIFRGDVAATYPAREAGRAVTALERRLADDAVGWLNLDRARG